MGAKVAPIPADHLDHVSIAVPDLEEAAAFYREKFGCAVGEAIEVPADNMRIAYVELANIKIELMQPLDNTSAVGKFLARNPAGGIHHICVATPDADGAATAATAAGLRVLDNGGSCTREGHHGRKLFFLHPKDCMGTLIEIEEPD